MPRTERDAQPGLPDAALLRPGDWFGARIGALTTTRVGGVSEGPFASLNLGRHCGDDPAHVRTNRARLDAILPSRPAWLRQVHGTVVVDAATVGTSEPQADASFTSEPGVVCAVLTADCLPVVLADVEGAVVGVAHAGWRGLAQGVLEATVASMRSRAPDARLRAWIGPGISQAAYEVGDEVRAAFAVGQLRDEAAFRRGARPGKWMADLERLAEQRLVRLGVETAPLGRLCTVADAGRFFSYRRDGVTGRMATCAWIVQV